MIPAFNEAGYLPAGIHLADIEEVASRFGHRSEVRRVEMESVRWMVDLAVRAGVRRIVLNGSFVTDLPEPNDVDCALLIGGDYPLEESAARELEDGLPFLELVMVEQGGFERLVNEHFATDRRNVAKGMVEIRL
jgi:hypothetical protein